MNFKPLADKVLVEQNETASKTPNGIYIPEKSKDKPTTGTVIAVGPGKFNKDGTHSPMSVSIGDKILFGAYNGVEVTVEEKKYLLLEEGEILAILG